MLVVGGGALVLVGDFIWSFSGIAGLSETGDVEGAKRTGQTITFIGTGLVAVSIPLFTTNKKNKEKVGLYAGATGLL